MDDVAMRVEDALRLTGGSGGEEDVRDGIRRDVNAWPASRSPAQIIDVEHVGCRRRRAWAAPSASVSTSRARRRQASFAASPAGTTGGAERRSSRREHAEDRGRGLPALWEQERDRFLARPEAFEHRARDPICMLRELRVRELGRLGLDGHSAAAQRDQALEPIGDRLLDLVDRELLELAGHE